MPTASPKLDLVFSPGVKKDWGGRGFFMSVVLGAYTTEETVAFCPESSKLTISAVLATSSTSGICLVSLLGSVWHANAPESIYINSSSNCVSKRP